MLEAEYQSGRGACKTLRGSGRLKSPASEAQPFVSKTCKVSGDTKPHHGPACTSVCWNPSSRPLPRLLPAGKVLLADRRASGPAIPKRPELDRGFLQHRAAHADRGNRI